MGGGAKKIICAFFHSMSMGDCYILTVAGLFRQFYVQKKTCDLSTTQLVWFGLEFGKHTRGVGTYVGSKGVSDSACTGVG